MEAIAETVREVARRVSLPVLDDPEVQQAIARLGRALEEIALEYAPVLERARELESEAALIPIGDSDEHEFALEWLRDVHGRVVEDVKAVIGPWKRLGDTVHKAFVRLERLGLDPAEAARLVIVQKVRAWSAVVEQRRRDAERIAREQAAAAERESRIHHAIALTALALTQAAEYAASQEAAKTAESKGDAERAEEIRKAAEMPLFAPPPPPPIAMAPPVEIPEAPKGVAKNWRARLRSDVDESAAHLRVVRFVATHPEWLRLLPIDFGAADKAAKTFEARLGDVVDGLESYNDPTVRAGRRR